MSAADRLAWRCRRGLLELDLLLQDFLDAGYAQLTAAQRRTFEQLLEWPDQELLTHLLGLEQAKEREVADVIARIRGAARP